MSKVITIEFDNEKVKVSSDTELIKFLNTVPLESANPEDINVMVNYFHLDWPNHIWGDISIPQKIKGYQISG